MVRINISVCVQLYWRNIRKLQYISKNQSVKKYYDVPLEIKQGK